MNDDDHERLRSAIVALCKHIAAHAAQTLTLAELGRVAGWSPYHLQRRFKQIVGVSPREFQETCRLDAFKRHARAGGSLADATFAAAACRRDDRLLKNYRQKLQRYLDGGNPDLTLPLDIRATAFQRKVWNILRGIPYGETRSYSEIAATAGAPSAVRAVARAIATNPVALVIPCHRAVRKDGALAGYRWGIARKRRLLDSERDAAATAASDRGCRGPRRGCRSSAPG